MYVCVCVYIYIMHLWGGVRDFRAQCFSFGASGFGNYQISVLLGFELWALGRFGALGLGLQGQVAFGVVELGIIVAVLCGRGERHRQ